MVNTIHAAESADIDSRFAIFSGLPEVPSSERLARLIEDTQLVGEELGASLHRVVVVPRSSLPAWDVNVHWVFVEREIPLFCDASVFEEWLEGQMYGTTSLLADEEATYEVLNMLRAYGQQFLDYADAYGYLR
ncbi:hypothetical protein EON82_22705 [bacterium]|nr:MAG: hypothetical protein EON82_22705 [bacterium]